METDDVTAFKQVCCSLLMLLLGLLFCFPLTILAYFTYQAAVGNVTFCTLWTDIPGRVAIFVVCYYLASLCGFFPLPTRFRLNGFIKPFRIWNLDSWKSLFRNVFVRTPSSSLIINFQRNSIPIRESPETPLLQSDNRASFYEFSPIRRRTSNVNIICPNSRLAQVPYREISPRNERLEINEGSNGSLSFVESSSDGIVFPILKESTKPHYFSETRSQEIPDDRASSMIHRRKCTETRRAGVEAAKALVPVSQYGAFKPIASEQSLDEKLAIPPSNKTLEVARQQKRSSRVNDVPATDEWIRANEPLPATNDQLGILARNPANKERENSLKTETQINFAGIDSRNQQTDDATTNEGRGTRAKLHEIETELIFPRFPWCYLRNPRGVPTGAKKLHKRNLELEKRDLERYMARQRRQANLERLTKSLLAKLRSERITETQLPRSCQNINVIAKSLFESQNKSTVTAKGSDHQTETRCMSEQVNKDDADATTDRTDLTQEVEAPCKDLAENCDRPFFSQRIEPIQMQEVKIVNQRRKLPSQRFGAKPKTRSKFGIEKSNIKLEILRRNLGDSAQTTLSRPDHPSNLCSFKQLIGLTGPVADESFKVDDLNGRLFRHDTQTTTEVFNTFPSEQNIDIETGTQIADASGECSADFDASRKSTEGIAAEISTASHVNKSESNKNSDSE